MAMASKLDTIINAQHEQGQILAAVKQRLDDDHERIFGGPGQQGALKYLADSDEKISKALEAATKQFTTALTTVKDDIKELQTEAQTNKKVHKAYIAGGVAAGSFFGWLFKAGLMKLGVHI